MKAALALLMMTVVLAVAESTETEGEDFNGEFFQGMETGFFLFGLTGLLYATLA